MPKSIYIPPHLRNKLSSVETDSATAPTRTDRTATQQEPPSKSPSARVSVQRQLTTKKEDMSTPFDASAEAIAGIPESSPTPSSIQRQSTTTTHIMSTSIEASTDERVATNEQTVLSEAPKQDAHIASNSLPCERMSTPRPQIPRDGESLQMYTTSDRAVNAPISPPETRTSTPKAAAIVEDWVSCSQPASHTSKRADPSPQPKLRQPQKRKQRDEPDLKKSRGAKRAEVSRKANILNKAGKWLKSSEIPRGQDPSKRKPNWGGAEVKSRLSGWAGETDAGETDAGFNTQEPPVLDWADRPSFKHDDPSGVIVKWQNHSILALDDYDTTIDLMAYKKALNSSSFPAGLLRPIVPAYWLPESIDNGTPNNWWRSVTTKGSIKTVDEYDLEGVEPWWKLFPPFDSPMQQDYPQPKIIGIDPDETSAQRKARRADCGSDHAIKRICAEKLKEQATQRRDRLRNRQASPTISGPMRTRQGIRPLGRYQQPGLLVRTANREDMPQICTIYNHYINFTVVADETEPLTEHVITERWRKAQQSGLPTLVCCEESYLIKDRRKEHRGHEITIPEKVVGVGFLSDHPGKNVYQYTKRLQVFTHVEHYKRGIAKSLMDKLLKMVDDKYVEQVNCLADIEIDRYGPQPAEVRKLVVHYLYEGVKQEKLDHVSHLVQKYGFTSPVVVPGIAWKHDTRLNLAIFQREMGFEAESSSDSQECW